MKTTNLIFFGILGIISPSFDIAQSVRIRNTIRWPFSWRRSGRGPIYRPNRWKPQTSNLKTHASELIFSKQHLSHHGGYLKHDHWHYKRLRPSLSRNGKNIDAAMCIAEPNPYKKVCKNSLGQSTTVANVENIKHSAIIRTLPHGLIVDLNTINLDPIPSLPNIILVGIRDELPSNYSIIYKEHIEVGLDSNDYSHHHHHKNVFDIKTETQYTGIAEPPKESILSLKNIIPKANSFQIKTLVIQTPNNSAPIEGVYNHKEFFIAGIEARWRKFPYRCIENPLEVQLRELVRIFDELQAIEDKPIQSTDWNPDSFDNGIKIDAPLFNIQILRFTVPEPDSSERSILDANFNFGFPAHTFVFKDMDLIVEQYIALRNERPQVSVLQLGSTFEEISNTLTGWIKNYAKVLRDASRAAFKRAQKVAYQSFRQYQFVVEPFSTWPILVDPNNLSGTANIQSVSGGTCMKGSPPSCVPPSRCS